ncbi:MAG: phosphoenolpyruvate synthase [Ruminiclostridium sp.]|nr:phosphoenolpyruvate synthase [Ruminiclostridium sp.]
MYIFELKKASDTGYDIGGKAESLGKMLRMGLPVPSGYVIAAQAFENGSLKKEAVGELSELVKKLSAGSHTYAVRSSAVGEDGAEDSFAGAYETVLDVKPADIEKAVLTVAASAGNERVGVYAKERGTTAGGTAVVIQRYAAPEYAGVLFTADPISGSLGRMTGSFVKGAGEKLVSGEGMDGEFIIDAVGYSYSGSGETEQYARKLFKYAKKLASDGVPKDIEWAVSGGRVYILQSRPITTLFRNNYDDFDINDSLCGELLLSKTNVGEIFLRPVSPATFGMVDMVSSMLGIPLISNVCGQLYLNISGICSMIMSFGVSKEKAFGFIKELAGGIPDTEIPVYPYDRRILRRAVSNIFRDFFKSKPKKYRPKALKGRFTEVSLELIETIKSAKSKDELLSLWSGACEPFMGGALSAIMSGLDVRSLFKTRERLERICGTELADKLMSDCSGSGSIESLGPLLGIADIIAGKMTREEYTLKYGHRDADEMELSIPFPYESKDFPDNVIEEHKRSGIDAYAMKAAQEKRREEAVKEFKAKYPSHGARLDRMLKKYAAAVADREMIRSDALRIFCVIREFFLKAGSLTGLGDDIFMLYMDDVRALLAGNESCVGKIPARRANYEKQMTMPNFPSMICGRFTLDEWQAAGSPGGYYRSGVTEPQSDDGVITGVAGSAGQAEGRARVLKSIDDADTIEQGDILVVPAANIGWVRVFPKISALVTDVGAPLSHAVIVARELGIPAVVSCRSASFRIQTGDRIRVDGTLGKVFAVR